MQSIEHVCAAGVFYCLFFLYNCLMKRYIASLVILILVFIGQSTALNNQFIFRLPVFHLVMHIGAGFGIALLISALMSSFRLRLRAKKSAIILGTFLVGLIWEAFEAYFNITGFRFGTAAYFLDTSKDLLNDAIGGSIAAFLVHTDISHG